MKNQRIVIVDYGMGNVGSIVNMLSYLCVNSLVSSTLVDISSADKVILPGVGHFDKAIKNILDLNIQESLHEIAFIKKKPILGICLGMQIMCNSSEEGLLRGLSFVNAKVCKFSFRDSLIHKVPHMGWNSISNCKDSIVIPFTEETRRFYFVHSYYVECLDSNDILTQSNYGHDFVSAFEHENLLGVQFHPEKSHRYGIELFKNFISL